MLMVLSAIQTHHYDLLFAIPLQLLTLMVLVTLL